MDNLTKEQRRKNMQNIRSIDTAPEKIVMRELKKRRISFATHVSSITGKPDIVFRKIKTVVFIDSDFWHGHPKRFIKPKTNIKYWREKIKRNKERDKEVGRKLKKNGWAVLRFWEYDIKKRPDQIINKILEAIKFK